MAGSDHTPPQTPAGGDAGRSLLDRVSVIQGDITVQKVEAIVNAANSALKRGLSAERIEVMPPARCCRQ